MLQKLNARHYEIIQRLLQGQSAVQIESEMQVTAVRVNQLRKEPLFASELAEQQQVLKWAIRDKIQAEAESALGLYSEVLDGAVAIPELKPDENRILVPIDARIRVAKDMLDRAGFAPVNKTVELKGDITDMIKEAYQKNKAKRENEEEASTEDQSELADSLATIDVEAEEVVEPMQLSLF